MLSFPLTSLNRFCAFMSKSHVNMIKINLDIRIFCNHRHTVYLHVVDLNRIDLVYGLASCLWLGYRLDSSPVQSGSGLVRCK